MPHLGCRVVTAVRSSTLDATRFWRDGFAAIDELVDQGEVARLRTAYDEILDGTVAAPGDRHLGGITRQVKGPAQAHPAFDRNAALDAAIELATELLGEPVARFYDMLIFKGPGHPHATPWHQDIGYFGRPVAAPGTRAVLDDLQFWVALDDVDVENGCMHFVPGRHRDPSLEHRVCAGDPDDEGRLIEITDVGRQLDLSTAVACPLRAGGATIHLPGTPHFTPPNASIDRPRRAYIFNLAPRRFIAAAARSAVDEWGDQPGWS
jgi:hypothetical protein